MSEKEWSGWDERIVCGDCGADEDDVKKQCGRCRQHQCCDCAFPCESDYCLGCIEQVAEGESLCGCTESEGCETLVEIDRKRLAAHKKGDWVTLEKLNCKRGEHVQKADRELETA